METQIMRTTQLAQMMPEEELTTLYRDQVRDGVHQQAAAAFSAVASRYDLETEPNPAVARVRALTIARLARLYAPGDLVLELGCGTGAEALALARAGIRVQALDVAPGMVAATEERIRGAGLSHLVRVRQLAASEAGALLREFAPGSFAGAYSSFGPLNCEPDLATTADALAALVRPGGHVLISAINRFHPFEFLWYAAHGDRRRAVRRWGGRALGTVSPAQPDRVTTYYYTPSAFARRFAPHFRVVDCRALLLFLPPPYLAHLMVRFPRLFRIAAAVETRLAGLQLLRALGDHFWLELERM